ncbi:MAG: ABC transporter permease, partial [Acidobacteriaceae bacterium]|nr:ABC transporter permease [Acidobacteriaceae bacterium]
MLQELSFAFRTLRKNPGFTLAAVLALSVGMGANSAIFSVIDGVLLRPLPFPEPDRLFNVWESELKRNIPRMVIAPGDYYDLGAQNRDFASVGAFMANTFNLASSEGEPERYAGAVCDAGFFQTLQVNPVLGRTFTDAEDSPGRDDAVVLGYTVWKQRFGGDPKILEQKLILDGKSRTVIGVMPAGFDYPAKSVMWAPLALDNDMRARHDFHRLRVIARLKHDVSIEHARASFQTLAANLAQQFAFTNKDESIVINSMLEDAVGQIRPALYVLLAAVAFVLLIACANVANLLLVKASVRRRELAIRAALGAERFHIVRQVLLESLLLSIAGGAQGLLLAELTFKGLLALAPANIPRLTDARLNATAIAYTFALAVLTSFLFGIAPALHAARSDVQSLLKEGARGATARGGLRSALVVAQVTAAMILLTGAGLLIRSFYEIAHIDPGFEPRHLMTMRLAPAPFRYLGNQDLQIQFVRDILAKVHAIPGVTSSAVSTDVPLLGNPIYIMRFEGRPPVTPAQAPLANYFVVTPGFFDTMGMRIVRGRAITERDTKNTPLVAVVNQTLVDRYFPGQDPIGQRLEIAFSVPPVWREIIGVVADAHTQGLDQDTPVQVYTAYFQQPHFMKQFVPAITVLARTQGNPESVGAPIKSAILSIDRSQPVYSLQPMTSIVSESIAQRRFSLLLLSFFALSALFLAAFGLYGVMSYSVSQRTSEIGLRMALGAKPAQVLFMVERQGLLL